jgi:hypothetical protein
MSTKKVVRTSVAEIKAMLDAGKTRKDIAEHFGCPMSSINQLFKSNAELAGLRARRSSVVFELDENVKVAQEVVNTTVESAVLSEQEEPEIFGENQDIEEEQAEVEQQFN